MGGRIADNGLFFVIPNNPKKTVKQNGHAQKIVQKCTGFCAL
jgi:hypothetical protein